MLSCEVWLYLVGMIELYSRNGVVWSMSTRIKAMLLVEALRISIWRRKLDKELVVHPDCGYQYVSHEYRKLLNATSRPIRKYEPEMVKLEKLRNWVVRNIFITSRHVTSRHLGWLYKYNLFMEI
jgi:hypothetical protein